MSYILVKQQIENVDDWKAVFENHAEARAEHGITGEEVFQTNDDPNILVLFECDSFESVQAWIESDQLRDGWNEANVTHTETLFLKKIKDVDSHSQTDVDDGQ